jgi:hypothetical protein
VIQQRKDQNVTDQQQSDQHQGTQQISGLDATASLLYLILDKLIRINVGVPAVFGHGCHGFRFLRRKERDLPQTQRHALRRKSPCDPKFIGSSGKVAVKTPKSNGLGKV